MALVAPGVALVRAAARRRRDARLNPRACGDPGWQLSFAAVAGILASGGRWRRAAPRARGADGRRAAPGAARRCRAGALRRGLGDGVAITVAATLATAPLVAHHFGAVPLAGLPRTCSRCRRSRRPCGSGWSRRRSAWLRRCCPAAGRLAGRSARSRALPLAYLAGSPSASPTCPAAASSCRWLVARAGARRTPRSALAYGPRLARRAAARARRTPSAAARAAGALELAAALAAASRASRGAAVLLVAAVLVARRAPPVLARRRRRAPHGPLPRRRPGRRHAHPAPRRHRRAVRRRPAGGARVTGCCGARA